MDEKQIQALEKLLDQSVMGFHHLFESRKIADILKTPTEELDFFTAENVASIQKLFSALIQKSSMEEKRAFLDRLNPHDYEILLRSYFHIVDSTLLKQEHQKH